MRESNVAHHSHRVGDFNFSFAAPGRVQQTENVLQRDKYPVAGIPSAKSLNRQNTGDLVEQTTYISSLQKAKACRCFSSLITGTISALSIKSSIRFDFVLSDVNAKTVSNTEPTFSSVYNNLRVPCMMYGLNRSDADWLSLCVHQTHNR